MTPGKFPSNIQAAAASLTPSSAGQGIDPTAHHRAAIFGKPSVIQSVGLKTPHADNIRRYWQANVIYLPPHKRPRKREKNVEAQIEIMVMPKPSMTAARGFPAIAKAKTAHHQVIHP